jgi:ketosteroid isomerase-like protein
VLADDRLLPVRHGHRHDMQTTNSSEIAVRFLQAWSSGDFDTARAELDEDATFLGPLGETHGADAYIDGVRGLTQTVSGVTVHGTVAEDDTACVRYDLVTKSGDRIPTVGWYEIRAGKIASVRAYFDPRPMLA